MVTSAEMSEGDPKARSPLDAIESCIATLQAMVDDTALLADLPDEQRVEILKLAGILSRPTRDEIRKRRRDVTRKRRADKRQQERAKRMHTGIRQARAEDVFRAPLRITGEVHDQPKRTLDSPRNCYVCKKPFRTLHHFYDSMCGECGDFNYSKRFQAAPMPGQVAIITGARVKIGYHAALMMLRAGAEVIVTTRFPVDAATRFANEHDSKDWLDRLHVYGLDLRHTPSVELFTQHIKRTFSRLDVLINNAAQTVRRPTGFYRHLMTAERAAVSTHSDAVQKLLSNYQQCRDTIATSLPAPAPAITSWTSANSPGVGIQSAAELSQMPLLLEDHDSSAAIFPQGKYDADLQQVDLRETNSWRLRLGEIDTVEMLEVQLINAVAPFVLTNGLIPLMQQDNTGQKHVVNVTAMEGKFHRFKKYDRHPHTNMAKAALNMLTHTAAAGLEKHGIYINAVDTGWVTDEDPAHLASFKQEFHDFEPQLDIVDGAARVCDPLFHGILSGTHWNGKFLKDYFPIDW